MSKKNILMIATGGTIASKNLGEGLAPAMTSRELLSSVPEIADMCKVDTVQPFNLDSTNIYYVHWLEIARIIEENYDKYDGFVVTHGTDTMAYTAAALSYLIQNNAKPVVLTGSQKSAYLRDTDARQNLADAFFYCADEDASGVHIVFDSQVILGTRAKKTRTRSYNAFSSIDYPNTAIIRDGKLLYYIKDEKPQGKPRFYHNLNSNVYVLLMTPGLSPNIFDYLDNNFDGLVVESFGSGGLPAYENDRFFHRLKKFIESGKTVVMTTQVEREGSALDKYEVGRRLHGCGKVLEARSMTLEATFTKLMWVLAEAKSENEVHNLFNQPVRHDIF